MSLLIVGSASRITQNIVLQLARTKAYSSITISDLLPCYSFHNRYYNLRKALSHGPAGTTVALNKLTRVEELYKQVQEHRDVLYVTHDYFSSVTSKTKLMELTADFAKNVTTILRRSNELYLLLPLSTITSASITLFRITLKARIRCLPTTRMRSSFVQISRMVLRL